MNVEKTSHYNFSFILKNEYTNGTRIVFSNSQASCLQVPACVCVFVRARVPNLIIHLNLQLDNLVLHACVELLQVLCRTRLDFQLLQLLPGLRTPERALDDDGGGTCPQKLLALQPTADPLLNDHGLVVQQEL